MAVNIFSTYSTHENRVTASVLAVLQSLALSRIERLLGALLEESEFQLVGFQNQPAKDGAGVPDALIVSSCRIYFETKIVRNTVTAEQIKRHLKRLEGAREVKQVLLVLTPDDSRPSVLNELDDNRIAWSSFSSFDQKINELLQDEKEVISEREQFLLRELQEMFERESLLLSPNDVVVVPARSAWPEYEKYSAYVCQPNRSFQHVSRIAFYSDGHIRKLVPKILKSEDNVEFESGKHTGPLGQLVDRLLQETARATGASYKVMLLSPPDSPETIRLDRPIPNDLKTKEGRTVAFVQNQRYVRLESLTKAKSTSDLID